MIGLKKGVCILFLTLSTTVFGQFDFEGIFDSRSTHEKIQLSRFLKDRYIKGNLDSLYILGLHLAEYKDDLKFLGFRYLGSYFLRSGNLKRSISFLDKSLGHFQVCDNVFQISELLNELGNAYLLLGDHAKSSEYYIQSLKIGLKSDDVTARFNGMFGLGRSFFANGDTIVGLHLISTFLEESIRFQKYESAADASAFLGMIFSDLGDKSVSKLYYKSSIDQAKKCSTKTHLANALTNQAILDCEEGKMESAEDNFLKSLQFREKQGAKKPTIEAHFNLGNYYLMISNLEKAEYYLTKSANLAKESKMIVDEYDAVEVLLEVFSISKNQESILTYTNVRDSLKESISKRKEISFDIGDLTSQIIKTGSPDILASSGSSNRIFFLWFGTVSLIFSCLVVLIVDRSKLKIS